MGAIIVGVKNEALEQVPGAPGVVRARAKTRPRDFDPFLSPPESTVKCENRILTFAARFPHPPSRLYPCRVETRYNEQYRRCVTSRSTRGTTMGCIQLRHGSGRREKSN